MDVSVIVYGCECDCMDVSVILYGCECVYVTVLCVGGCVCARVCVCV